MQPCRLPPRCGDAEELRRRTPASLLRNPHVRGQAFAVCPPPSSSPPTGESEHPQPQCRPCRPRSDGRPAQPRPPAVRAFSGRGAGASSGARLPPVPAHLLTPGMDGPLLVVPSQAAPLHVESQPQTDAGEEVPTGKVLRRRSCPGPLPFASQGRERLRAGPWAVLGVSSRSVRLHHFRGWSAWRKFISQSASFPLWLRGSIFQVLC